MSTNITEYHKDAFNALVSGDYANFALVSTTFDGNPTAAIAAVNSEFGEYIVTPIAVFVTDDMYERMTSPADDGQETGE